MHIHPLERKWIYVVLAVIGIFLLAIFYTAIARNIHPPSHQHRLASLHLSAGSPRISWALDPAGRPIKVTLVWPATVLSPDPAPAGTPVTFRIASADVLHGVHIPMTNMGTMVVPGMSPRSPRPFPSLASMLSQRILGLRHDHRSKVTVCQGWPAASARPIGR